MSSTSDGFATIACITGFGFSVFSERAGLGRAADLCDAREAKAWSMGAELLLGLRRTPCCLGGEAAMLAITAV